MDYVQKEFKKPEITLDYNINLPYLISASNKYSEDNSEDKRHFPHENPIGFVSCGSVQEQIWKNCVQGVGVFFMENPQYVCSDANVTGKMGSLGGERDAYFHQIEELQAKGIQLDVVSARQYLLWAMIQNAHKKYPFDKRYLQEPDQIPYILLKA